MSCSWRIDVSFLDAYLTLSWLLCLVAAMLAHRSRHKVGWGTVPAILAFALGWPVILPIVALVMRLNERSSRPPA